MPEFDWTEVSPLHRAVDKGHGTAAGRAGVRLSEGRGFSLYQVMARRGLVREVAAAARARFGVEPPARPGWVAGNGVRLLWSGPDQFLVLGIARDLGDLVRLREAFAGLASVTEQSDGRCLVRVEGPRAAETLAKVSSLDFHPSMFPPGAAATTSIDHTSVVLWREADGAAGPAYGLLTFATFAESIWHALGEAAAEFGSELGTFDLAA